MTNSREAFELVAGYREAVIKTIGDVSQRP